MSTKYAIIGAGSWGTAMARLLAEKGIEATMLGHDQASVDAMIRDRENTKFLPGFSLPEGLEITTDAAEALDGAAVALSVVPTRWVRRTWRGLKRHVPPGLPLISLTKGIENKTLLRPTEILQNICAGSPVACLSGPSHAEEVARNMPTTVTVASRSRRLRETAQEDLSTGTFRVYTNTDVLGVELGGAMKNVIALAAGMVDGLGFGDNTKAALLTRGLAEMSELGRAMGAKRNTFMGMAGVGDLITTAFSPFGRNRAVGERLGRGETLKDILDSMVMVVEGVGTTRSLNTLANRMKVEMPITRQVYLILSRGKDPRRAVTELMSRRQRGE
jgi:glycerol-3-phosphate dehydrogenase (NAD(P)+)